MARPRATAARRPAPRTHRPNVPAAVGLVVGGVLAFLSGFTTWGSAYGQPLTGLELVDLLGAVAPAGWSPIVGQAVTGTVVAGALTVVLGVLMLAPFRTHRPLGGAAALVVAVMVAAVVLVAVRLGDLFQGGPGAWMFVGGPAVAVVGVVLGLVRR